MIYFVFSLLNHRIGHVLIRSALCLLRIVLVSDALFIRFINRFLLCDCPQASLALQHYRRGGGRPLKVSARALFEEDAAFAGFVADRIGKALGESQSSGTIHVPQWRLSNHDWRMALGSFDVEWSVRGERIQACLQGCYDWQPGDMRITRLVHRAAENLKRNGASAFQFFSPPQVIASSRISAMASSYREPRDRLYL